MESHTLTGAATTAPFHGASQDSLSAEVVQRDSIPAGCIEAMYRLYSANYLDTSPELFRTDLAAKTHVLLLRNAADQLCGFSTIELYSDVVDDSQVRVVYSGDTIIAPAYWGSQALAYEWLRFAGSVERQAPDIPLYWLLIVKGHRTYRFLPTFARSYIPHYSNTAPRIELRIREELAQRKFGERFDARTGVVHFPSCMGRLNSELAEIPERHLRLPDVAHFVSLNPGYREGDELVCLCRLQLSNLRRRAARIFAGDDRDNGVN